MTKLHATVMSLAISLLLAGGVKAQQQSTDEPPAPPTVRELADQMSRTLAQLKTVRVSIQRTVQVAEADAPEPMTAQVAYKAREGAPLVTVLIPNVHIYADGETWTEYVPDYKQYRNEPYRPQIWSRLVPFAGRVSGFGAPLAKEQDSIPFADIYKKELPDASVEGPVKVGEFECWKVTGTATVQAPGPEQKKLELPVSIWHRRQDAFPVKFSIDVSPLVPPEKAVLVATATKLATDGPIADAALKFTPPNGATQFEPQQDAPQPGRLEQFDLSGKPAPSFQAQRLGGGVLDLASQQGKVVVLDFWASWCGPCMTELPHIQELWQEVQGQDVAIIGVNLDRKPEDAAGAAERLGLTFPTVLDTGGNISRQYAVEGIPCLVLVNPQGRIMGRFVGFQPGIKSTVKSIIQDTLKSDSSADEPHSQPAQK